MSDHSTGDRHRPVASEIVGTDAAAKAAPDGHTLLMVASSFAIVPATHPGIRNWAGIARAPNIRAE